MSVLEWIDTYDTHYWRIIWSSYRKLGRVKFESKTTEFRADALTDWAVGLWELFSELYNISNI